MTASDTMAAPYGRVMSGRGFAPASFQVHDKPATGQLAKDLYKVGGIANMDSWLQQAKTSNHLKLFGKDFLNNQIPSAMSGTASISSMLSLHVHKLHVSILSARWRGRGG